MLPEAVTLTDLMPFVGSVLHSAVEARRHQSVARHLRRCVGRRQGRQGSPAGPRGGEIPCGDEGVRTRLLDTGMHSADDLHSSNKLIVASVDLHRDRQTVKRSSEADRPAVDEGAGVMETGE